VLDDEELDEDEPADGDSFLDAFVALALAAGFAALAAGLAAKDGGLARRATAGSRKRATQQEADLAAGGFMAALSKAKVACGSSDSASI
jgi:hypothetical protein